jgi:hypothetical protein
MNKEICICSAVKTTTGRIFRGHRHSDCFRSIAIRHLSPGNKDTDQGFVTSLNRYVDRAEGYRLQIEAGIKSNFEEYTQNQDRYCQEGQLYSEDLY